MVYRNVETAFKRRELDRLTWADVAVSVVTYDVFGNGEHLSEIIDFGSVFTNEPFFYYGVELQPDETLDDGDYPFVACGVAEWDLIEDDEDPTAAVYYRGARIWVHIASSKAYRLRFQLAFEGTIFKNTSLIRDNG